MSSKKRTQETVETKPVNEPEIQPEESKKEPRTFPWMVILSWAITVLLVSVLIMVLFKFNPFSKFNTRDNSVAEVITEVTDLPEYKVTTPVYSVNRLLDIDTSIPSGTRQFPIKYTVEQGDSIFSISKKYGIQPETILYANYDLLNDDPTFLSPGWKLTIPPTDGIYYKWKEDDTLQKVANKYYAEIDDIIDWPGNGLDVENPVTDNLEYVMIPNGYRPITSWIQTLPFAPSSGATRTVAGAGGCEVPAGGNVGTGYFSWPTGNTYLSGFDFSSYHLGIDIAAGAGAPIYAADYGIVIYAGWNDSGYGNLIEIDHNNGYQTIYAHLSSVMVSCGANVNAGQIIGVAGSTGKSTGEHLHFEIRQSGGFVNPWTVLP